MIHTTAQPPEWQSRPLCCRYLVVFFEALSIQMPEDGVLRALTVRWALGVLADGQSEVLGVWLEPESGAAGRADVFEDLKVRGVEKVRLVASNEPAVESAAMGITYPGATVVPLIGQLLRQCLAEVASRDRALVVDVLGALRATGSVQAARASLTDLAAGPWGAKHPAEVERWRATLERLGPLHALAPRLRRIVLAGDDVVQQLHRSLSRAVGRHGCFAGRAAAASFLVDALRRAERRLGVSGAGLGACTDHRAEPTRRTSQRSRIEALGL